MIVAEDPLRYSDETTEYCDGLNQVAAVILAAKKMRFVNGLRRLKSEADCSRVVVPEGRSCQAAQVQCVDAATGDEPQATVGGGGGSARGGGGGGA